MPHYPCEFEIPDEWLWEAGIKDFVPVTDAYRSTAAKALIRLTDIEPTPRLVSKDWRGFDRVRLIRLLKGFVAGNDIEPVPVAELHRIEFPSSPYRYRVRDGFHRFYGSIAAGYTMLPVT